MGDGEVSSDLLDRLAVIDCLHGDLGLDLRAMDAALAHCWEPPSRVGALLRCNDGACPRRPPHSHRDAENQTWIGFS